MLLWGGETTGGVRLQDGGNLSLPVISICYVYQKN
jgi:hypothetical protein